MPDLTCVAADCGAPIYCRGLCTKHYQRLRKHGALERPSRSRQDPSSELARRTRQEASGCVVWLGPRNDDGYGVIWQGQHHYVMAHRAAWELVHGAVPEGAVLDHICRVRHCVNVDHLDPVTNAVNVLRGIGITATNRRKRMCAKGHAYDAENTYWRPDGSRDCRECKRQSQRQRRNIARGETKGDE